MPQHRNGKIIIDGQEVDLGLIEDLPLAISYSLEDRENFQQKTPNKALNVKIPATVNNDRLSNTFHNPSVDDLTDGQLFKATRPAVIEANGYEILNGKAFLTGATHTDKPQHYDYNFFGGNGDWIIELKEKTLYD